MFSLADLPPCESSVKLVIELMTEASAMTDRWIPDAVTSAAANNSQILLGSLEKLENPSQKTIDIVGIVANHHARSDDTNDAATLLANAGKADAKIFAAIVRGLSDGFGRDQKVEFSDAIEASLEQIVDSAEPGIKGSLVKLLTSHGSTRFAKYGKEIGDSLLMIVQDAEASERSRVDAAKQLLEFLPDDADAVTSLLDEVTPRTPPEVSSGLIEALGSSRSDAVGAEIVDRFSSLRPSLKKIAMIQLLKRPASTNSLLAGIEQGKVTLGDLALDQKQSLASHSSRAIRDRAQKLVAQGGALPSADRQKVLDDLMFVTKVKGDAKMGKVAFTTHCAKCHVHSGEGVNVGPDLTGMAVHPKDELLTHILDPSRSVEGNFRVYSVLTADGVVINGMLASESKTAIELFDAEGKKKSILRDDIEQFVMSTKSIMPEGFEKTMKPEELTDLLEFLTQRGQFMPIDLHKVATLPSDCSLFSDPNNQAEKLIFDSWTPVTFAGIPFQLIDPKNGTIANAIVLHSPNGEISRKMPRSVEIPFNGQIKTLHLLSGVGGWAHPYGNKDAVALTIRFHFADGSSDDHDLRNGQEFADFIRRVDVPNSQFAFDLRGRQIRYLAVSPRKSGVISRIELRKGNEVSSPVVMAATAETSGSSH